MKISYYFLFLFVFFLPIYSKADTVRELNLHYEDCDFKTLRHDNVLRICPTGNLWAINFESETDPALPLLFYTVAELGGKKFYDVDLSVKTSERILVEEDVAIATGFPISSSTSSTSDEWDEYNFDGYYPKQNVKVEEFSGIWSIWISPYEYDPTTRSLYLTKDFDITIRISPKYTGPSTTSIESADAVHNVETVDPQLVGIPSLVNPDLRK